jgi:hypothetical protein
MSIVCILMLAALVAAIVSAIGKCPLWVAVLLLAIAGLLSCLPLR